MCSVWKRILSLSELRRHRRCVHKPVLSVIQCSYCGKDFQRKDFLSAHVSRVHEQGDIFNCVKCNNDLIKNQLWTDIKAHPQRKMGLLNTSVMTVTKAFALVSSCRLMLTTIKVLLVNIVVRHLNSFIIFKDMSRTERTLSARIVIKTTVINHLLANMN